MNPGLVVLENVLQALYTGVVVGCIYGLMCVGLALIFSVMRVINFAQGEFLMLGMYAALFCFAQLEDTLALIARGSIRPVISGIHPLSEIRQVHQRLEKGGVPGRIVVRPGA